MPPHFTGFPEPRSSPASERASRLATFVIAAAGIVGCATHLVLVWSRAGDSPLAQLASTTTSITAGILLAVALLIAWRGADHGPNAPLPEQTTIAVGSRVGSPGTT